jgi:hypothetical protein
MLGAKHERDAVGVLAVHAKRPDLDGGLPRELERVRFLAERGELAGWEAAQLVRRGERAERRVGTKAEVRGPVLGDPDSGDRLAVRVAPAAAGRHAYASSRVRRSAS